MSWQALNGMHMVSSDVAWFVKKKIMILIGLNFYASAFRRRRHYVFGLSVRPSVRSPKYPLLTCTWVRWSTWPTVTVLRHVRPSVRPSVRPTREAVGLLIFLILALFWLSETGQIWGFRAFPGECMEGMAWNFARWCTLTTFRID